MTPTSEKLQHQVIAAFNRRDWRHAETLAKQLLQRMPRHAGAHYIAGVAKLEQHRLPRALTHLHMASSLAPERADFHAIYARSLTIAQLSRDALAAADRAWALSPNDPATLDALGFVYTTNNRHDQAAPVFRRAVEIEPRSALRHYNLGTSLMFTGNLEGAESELETAIDLQPTFWKAHATLSQLRRWTPEDNHTPRLRALLTNHADDPQAVELLNMALAHEYEDLDDHTAAFTHLTCGNAAAKAHSGYTIEKDKCLINALIRESPARQSAASGHATSEPIFVVGLPRSGTTLVERALSSHPDVHSAGELRQFGVALKQLSDSQTPALLDPDTVARCRELDWRELGQRYLSATQPITGHTPQFVDKFPHNFLYVGYIVNALPNAKIICLRRNPLDTCLGNFRQMFSDTLGFHGYALDLLDTGRYYVLFDRLMAHWQRLYPGHILEVQYEQLVDEQESITRRMLEFCGLSWDPRCLRFEDNAAPVATASAAQVRSKMNRASIGRWQCYEAQLGELKALLIDAGVDIEAFAH